MKFTARQTNKCLAWCMVHIKKIIRGSGGGKRTKVVGSCWSVVAQWGNRAKGSPFWGQHSMGNAMIASGRDRHFRIIFPRPFQIKCRDMILKWRLLPVQQCCNHCIAHRGSVSGTLPCRSFVQLLFYCDLSSFYWTVLEFASSRFVFPYKLYF